MRRPRPARTAIPTDPDAAPSSPRTLFGYDVLGLIGHGAGSTIYCVSHPASKQLYALKHVVRTFFDGSATDAVAALLDGERKLSPSELDRLSHMIAEARKEGR